jgi:hypothetical protein
MRCSTGRLLLPVGLLAVGCLAAGCGGTVTSSIGSLPSRTATVSARPSVTAAPTARPSAQSVARSAPIAEAAAQTVTASAPAAPLSTVTVTAPPVTQTVTVTAAPSAPAVTTTAPPSTAAVTTLAPTAPSTVPATPSASSGASLLWLWILLGVLVLAGLIAWIARSARRRSAAAADWRSGLIDAYAEGSALHDAMSAAEAPGGLAAADAAARWADIQRRGDDLAQALYALREAVPPDSPDLARIDDSLASLQAVRSAMDAERAPGGASLEQAEVVRSRLASFESSLRALGGP